MTLGKLIEKIVEQKGQQYDAQILTDWVNEIEGQVVEEVINQAEGYNIVFAPYDYTQDAERTLRIPDRFQDVYLNYLYAKIDFGNQETEAGESPEEASHVFKILGGAHETTIFAYSAPRTEKTDRSILGPE